MSKFLNLKDNSEFLEIEFKFKNKSLEHNMYIKEIEIYKNDTLKYHISSNSDTISTWSFPEIPEGFKITYPNNVNAIQRFKKTENLNFEFLAQDQHKLAYGSWNYKPEFLNKENRWMFDEQGNKKININCIYESWIGKDIIRVHSISNIEIIQETVSLKNEFHDNLGFKIKSKNNVIFLTLEKDLKNGDFVSLEFQTKKENLFKENIIIRKGSTIGVIGKYK